MCPDLIRFGQRRRQRNVVRKVQNFVQEQPRRHTVHDGMVEYEDQFTFVRLAVQVDRSDQGTRGIKPRIQLELDDFLPLVRPDPSNLGHGDRLHRIHDLELERLSIHPNTASEEDMTALQHIQAFPQFRR
jgi:hypothetical protein